LGVIAHRLESGEMQLPYYEMDTYSGQISLYADVKTRVPLVDLDTLKRIIDVQETRGMNMADSPTFIARDTHQQLYASTYENIEDLALNTINLDKSTFAYSLPAESKIVLLTSDYVSYIKSAIEIADLRGNDLRVEIMEGFRKDAFSTEYVHNLTRWDSLLNRDFLILISTLGYTQKFIGDRIIEKMSLPVPYKFARMRGYPAFLIGAETEQDYIVISHAGRAAKIRVDDLPLRENRLMSLPLKGNLIGAMSAHAKDEILIATASAYAKRVRVDSIPYVPEMNTTGEKVVQRGNPIHASLFDPQKSLYALTNQRLIEIDPAAIPLLNTQKTDYKLFPTKKGEHLISLFSG
jgi:DNA gyrase/topoisomerase IV subunit A